MAQHFSKYTRSIYLAGDLLLLNGAFLTSYIAQTGSIAGFREDYYLSLAMITNISWLVSVLILGSYKIYRSSGYPHVLLGVVRQLLLSVLLVQAYISISEATFYNNRILFLFYIILAIGVFTWRLTFYSFLRIYRKKGYNYRRVVIAGTTPPGTELSRLFRNEPDMGYTFLGFYHNNPSQGIRVEGTLNDLVRDAVDLKIDEIYCVLSDLSQKEMQQLITFADNNFIRVKLLPDTKGFSKFKIDTYANIPVLILRHSALDDDLGWYSKRAFDILFSSFVIVFILSWLIPLLAIAIKSDSRGPVFFVQKRSGFRNRTFNCYKLRSMVVNREADTHQAMKYDKRITRVGRYLRKLNLDELPQFFNVLLGDMSVVGPRPHMIRHTEDYSRQIDRFMARHAIKPGITGLSQVKGYRGETSEPGMMQRRVQIDLFYIEHWSFFLDLKILFMTLFNIVRGDEQAY